MGRLKANGKGDDHFMAEARTTNNNQVINEPLAHTLPGKSTYPGHKLNCPLLAKIGANGTLKKF